MTSRNEITQPSLRDSIQLHPENPALKCRDSITPSLRDGSTPSHFADNPKPDPKWLKVLFSDACSHCHARYRRMPAYFNSVASELKWPNSRGPKGR